MGLRKSTGCFILSEGAELWDHVVIAVEEVGDGFEVGVLGEADGIGPHDEGVAVIAVGFGERAIDGDGVATSFDGVFSFFDFDRDVAVDDEEVLVHAKGGTDCVDEVGIVDLLEIGIFDFAMSFGVFDKVALEGGHAGFSEERRVGVGPEPVIIVEVPGDGVGALAIGVADDLLEFVEKGSAAEGLPANAGFAEGAVGVGGDAGVEDEGVVSGECHAALSHDEEHVLPETLAGDEGLAEAVEAGVFFVRESVGIGGVDGGEMGVFEGVGFSIDGDGAVLVIDEVEETAVFHVPLGVAGDDLAGELELEDGNGFVHFGDEVFIGKVSFAFGVEAGCGVVGVDGFGKLGEGGEEDAVAFLELPEAEVAEGNAKDGGDEDFGSEGRAHPGNVVVAPGKADLGLVFEVVDDAVSALAAIEKITGDDDFGNDEVTDETGGFVEGGDVLIVVGKGLDHGVDVGGIAVEGGFVEEGDVECFEFLFHEAEDLVLGDGAGESSDEAELLPEEFFDKGEALLAVLEFVLVAAEFLDGIVEEGEEGVFFRKGEFVAEDFVDEGTEAAGRVVDDVAELPVIAVDIADDVDAAGGKGELCLKEGDLGHDGGGGGELAGEKAEGGAADLVHGVGNLNAER